MGYARAPVTPCPRCNALVPPHARFCSECGAWVVHAAMGGGEVPMAPVVISGPVAPNQSVEYAGTLPASSAMLAAMTVREQMPDAFAPTDPPVIPKAPPNVNFATMVRTLDSGELPTPSMMGMPSAGLPSAGLPSAAVAPLPAQPERTLSRAHKTIADERPSVAPSVSLGRPPRPLGAFLVSYQYEPLGTFWPLGLGANLVGRTGTGRPDLDVGISDTTVSSEQASIEVDASGITVEDRGSRNGTSVNGRPIGGGGRVPVAHGDRIKFGSFETIVVKVPYPAGS